MSFNSAVFSYTSDFRSFSFPTFRKFFVSASDHFVPHARNNYHPHVLSHRVLALLTLLLMTVKIASISLIALSPAPPVEAAAITTETIITLANTARVENSLGELKANSLLAKAAQNKANDMLARQYFAHNTPTGETPWTFIKAVGYSYVTAGENLAIDFTEAESVQSAWMNSPGHRANILNKNFQEIGIGIAKGMYDGHQTTIVVQMFGTPIAQKVEMQPAPTPVAQPTAPAAVPAPQPTATPAPTQVTAPAPEATPQPITTQAVPDATAAPLPTGNAPLEITETNTSLQGNQLYLTVTASHSAVKLLAIYGNRSVMLSPTTDNVWQGYIPMANIGSYDNLVVQAYDINGNIHQSPVAQFSNSFAPDGEVNGASVTIFGKTINPRIWEQKIFLIIMASLIACLVMAIAIKRHVQHVSLIANTSFVAMLAAILMMT